MNLNVYFGKEKCGELKTTDNRGIVFQYSETYLSNPASFGISLSLPLQKEEFLSLPTRTVFRRQFLCRCKFLLCR